ncbi:MAG TPA: SPFH domain-containing protein [Planctomycetota bacterium]|nr:SPFH domain-containing protein [Planctomycetota bacterium]
MIEEREEAARAALEATVSLSLRVLRGAMGVLVLLFLGSSVFTVEQHEVALVRRLGSVIGAPDQRVLPPGAHWAWPVIDEVVRVAARRDERLATDTFQLEARVTDVVGKPPERKNGLDPERDGYLITGDANVLHATIAVQWTIDDAYAFSSRAREVPELARPLLERAIAKTAAAMPVDDLLASRKETFLEEVRSELQRSLDALGIGVRAGTVFLAKDFAPPPQARESFAAVTKALQDRDTQISKARGEAAEVVGLARSEASRLRGEARSEAKRRTADVLADQAVFEALLPEWKRDPRAVKARLVADALARSRPEEGFVVPPGEEVRVRLERDTKPAQQKLLERAR